MELAIGPFTRTDPKDHNPLRPDPDEPLRAGPERPGSTRARTSRPGPAWTRQAPALCTSLTALLHSADSRTTTEGLGPVHGSAW